MNNILGNDKNHDGDTGKTRGKQILIQWTRGKSSGKLFQL